MIEKLRQIQALTDTERGATQAEAENAAAMLTRLLLEHNLELADLEGGVADDVTHEEWVDLNMTLWKRELAYHLSRHYLCQVILYGTPGQTDGPAQFVVVGEPENIAVMREMYAWLVKEMPKMADGALEAAKYEANGEMPFDEPASLPEYLAWKAREYIAQDQRDLAWADPAAFRQSYLSGLVWGLAAKMDEERHRVSSDAKDSWGLIPVKEEKVREYMDKTFTYETTQVTTSVKSAAVYRSGFMHGYDIPTEKQVRTERPVHELGDTTSHG